MKVFGPGDTLLAAALITTLARAHDGEDGKWLLETYNEDESCTKLTYAKLWGAPCSDGDSCNIETDDDGVFVKTVGGGCVTDRDVYLDAVFNGAPYLKIEEYSTNCTDVDEEPAIMVAYLADGGCHPNKYSHFKIAERDSGRVSVLISWEGCDYQYWNETWAADIATELNTGNCVTTEFGSWRAYLVTNTSSSSGAIIDKTSGSTTASSSSSSDSTSGSVADSSGSTTTAAPVAATTSGSNAAIVASSMVLLSSILAVGLVL